MKYVTYLFRKPTPRDAIQVFLELCFQRWMLLDLVEEKAKGEKANCSRKGGKNASYSSK